MRLNTSMDRLATMANGAVAWEGLRRNRQYREDWKRVAKHVPKSTALRTGARYLKGNQHSIDAQKWGLVTFSDPDKAAPLKPVLWQPGVLAGALRVRLVPDKTRRDTCNETQDRIVLSRLKSDRYIVDQIDGVRHIRLGGDQFWIQLFAQQDTEISEDLEVKLRIDGPHTMGRQLDSAAQLLSLYRRDDETPTLIGRRKPTMRLTTALRAFDIWNGFECPKGDLKDVASMLVGRARVQQDWGKNDRALKAQARRAIQRGEAFVEGRYRRLLRRKVI